MDESFLQKIDAREKLTEQEIDEALQFFRLDAQQDMQHVKRFLQFFWTHSARPGDFQKEAHMIRFQYILGLETNGGERSLLESLYIMEAQYAMECSMYSQCVKMLFRVLDFPDVPPQRLNAALSIMITILWNCGMLSESLPFVQRVEALLRQNAISPRCLFFAECGLMMAQALMKNAELVQQYIQKLENFSSQELTVDDRCYFQFYRLFSISQLMDEGECPDSFINDFQNTLVSLRQYADGIRDSLSFSFIPVLLRLEYRVPLPELIGYALQLIEVCYSLSDRLDLYTLLVDHFHITFDDYPDVYRAYYALLREYYLADRGNHRAVLQSEIELHKQTQLYKHYAYTDALTGLDNRLAYDTARHALITGEKPLPDSLYLAMFDVNRLKEINDRYGHETGDILLQGAAHCLSETFRAAGTIYRYGGDEFAAFLTMEDDQVDSYQQALQAATDAWSQSHHLPLSIASGFAAYHEPAGSSPAACLDRAFHLADQRMFENKMLYRKN